MSKPLIISIEGNIGSGKSTFIKKLEEHWNSSLQLDEKKIFFLSEPVDEWLTIRDENDEHILSKFYNDQEKYSFTFQMMAYITRLVLLRENIKQNKPNSLAISERSLYSDKHVFAKMLYDVEVGVRECMWCFLCFFCVACVRVTCVWAWVCLRRSCLLVPVDHYSTRHALQV